MRKRRIAIVVCPNCGFTDNDVCFEPKWGFIEWHCPECGQIIDLIKLLGISYGQQLPLNIPGEATE